MRAKELERQEIQTKIRMIMEANGQPMTVSEIRKHPTMAGLAGQKVGMLLRNIPGAAHDTHSKHWSITSTKTKVKKPKPRPKRGPYKKKMQKAFAEYEQIQILPPKEAKTIGGHFRVLKDGGLLLVINGISLPVEFE